MVDKVQIKKALGQNFLTDPAIAQLMVESLDIREGNQIIEIGAGTGAVTQSLASVCNSQGACLTAVEFDIDLIPILKSKILENKNTKIVNANILNFLDGMMPEVPQRFEERAVRSGTRNENAVEPGLKNTQLKIIGSLPYNITSPLIHRLIKTEPMPETCVFLIQKEVAQKICKQAPDSNYLSVFVQTFYTTEILKIVDKNLFSPIPKVDGAVIKLTRKLSDMLPIDISRYEKFLHRVFSHPRKMLNKVFTKEELKKHQLDGTKRPQDYGSDKYAWVNSASM